MFTRLCLFRKLVISKRDLILSEACLSWLNINFNQSEPYIIKEYLNKGTKYLNEHIAQQLSTEGFVVKFGGVFIHQKPIVKRLSECEENKSCELGDLLTVFLFVDRNKNLLFQSAFISQAKKEDQIDNKCQIYLYEFDEEFEFPKNICRDVSNNSLKRKLPRFRIRHKGLNYLILKGYPPYIKCIPFDAGIIIPWHFSIFQMLLGTEGLWFSKTPDYTSRGWSSIVWDLIRCTSQASFKGQTRGNDVIRDFLDKFNDFDKYDKYFIEANRDGEGGISILFIIVQDKEK